MKEAIGEDVYILDRNIDVHVRAIRKKLGEGKDYILTVRGVGYRFADLAGVSALSSLVRQVEAARPMMDPGLLSHPRGRTRTLLEVNSAASMHSSR